MKIFLAPIIGIAGWLMAMWRWKKYVEIVYVLYLLCLTLIGSQIIAAKAGALFRRRLIW